MAGVGINGNNPPQELPGQAAANAALAAPVSNNPTFSMSPAGLLEYCERQMSSINSQFNEQVAGLQQMNSDSTMLGGLKSAISGIGANGLTGSDADNATYDSIDAQINNALAIAQGENNSQLAASLTSIKTNFEAGGKAVSASEVTDVSNSIDTAMSNITANQQVAMINVGQVANDMNSILTQTTQMLQGMEQTQLKIAGNA